MCYTLRDKHVLITGGAAGIGLAIAAVCVRRGARVSLIDISSDTSAASAELRRATAHAAEPSVKFYFGDVGAREQVEKAIREAELQHGPVDVIVPNAGIASNGNVKAYDSRGPFNFALLPGVIYSLKAVLPSMVKRGRGKVLMVSSLMATLGCFCGASYAGPKAAVKALADSLRMELIGTGVDISLMLPGFVNTQMVRQGLTNPQSPQLARELVQEMVPKAQSPEQVAELAIVSLEKGHYLVRAPDIFSNLIVAAGANIAPRMFPIFLEFLLVPFYLLLYVVGGRTLNRRILRWRQSGKAKAS